MCAFNAKLQINAPFWDIFESFRKHLKPQSELEIQMIIFKQKLPLGQQAPPN